MGTRGFAARVRGGIRAGVGCGGSSQAVFTVNPLSFDGKTYI